MDKMLGFKVGSDLKGKKGCKILLIQPLDDTGNTYKNISHIFDYSVVNTKLTSYSAFCKEIADNMNESKNLEHSINGTAVVGTDTKPQETLSIKDVTQRAKAAAKAAQQAIQTVRQKVGRKQ